MHSIISPVSKLYHIRHVKDNKMCSILHIRPGGHLCHLPGCQQRNARPSPHCPKSPQTKTWSWHAGQRS